MAETYTTALPIRPGLIVAIGPLPVDLTAEEVERLATWLRLCIQHPTLRQDGQG